MSESQLITRSVVQKEHPDTRPVDFEYSLNLAPLLKHLGVSLLVSTYQAGKLVTVIERDGKPELAFHSFERAMGVAVSADKIAVGARTQIWFLRSAPEIAERMVERSFDACFLTRSSHFSGDVHIHEMAWVGEELWFANTLFSCLSTLDEKFSFVPRWKPPFVSALAAEDRCHLNGFALEGGKPRYATMFGETDSPHGWRVGKATGGCIVDMASNEVIARGLAMPHSPRVYRGQLWVLDSGRGNLATVDRGNGLVRAVVELPGYTRGLTFCGDAAFVGLSRIRETSTFGGIPIAERREGLKCGVAIIDLRTGRQAALLEFKSGVEEVFDIQIIPGKLRPLLAGPYAGQDGNPVIWTVPSPNQTL